jgi:hypothetical protein
MQRRSRSTATTFAPVSSRRGSGRRGRARLHRPLRLRAPGIAAIRASSCRSRMKFWPSALLALSPWRAMTSRSGSGGALTPRRRAGARISAAIRIAAAIGRGSARSWPAMSNAVPWSGAVRTIGRPSVMLTAFLEMQRLDRDQRLVVVHAQARVVIGARARRGTWCRPGGGRSPASLRPQAPAIAGSMISISSRPSCRLRRHAD